MYRKLILNSIIALFALLFLYTGISKLLAYSEYILEIRQSPYFKWVPVKVLWLIPALELVIVMLLYWKRWRLIGFYFAAVLMFLFTGYIIAIDQFTYYVPCSCGGILENLPENVHLVMNITFMVLALGGIYITKNTNTKNSIKNLAQEADGSPSL